VRRGPENGEVEIVRLGDLGRTRVLGGLRHRVGHLVIGGDSLVAAESDEGELAIWSLGAEDHSRLLPAAVQGVSAMELSADKSLLVVGRRDGRVQFLETASGVWLSPTLQRHAEVTALALTPDRARIAVGTKNREIAVCDCARGAPLLTLPNLPGTPRRLLFCPSGNRLVADLASAGLRVWETSGRVAGGCSASRLPGTHHSEPRRPARGGSRFRPVGAAMPGATGRPVCTRKWRSVLSARVVRPPGAAV
jgi:WD40 repeat protein